MTTDLEVRMTIKTLARKGTPKRAIPRQLGMSEGNVRYHLRRLEAGTIDGRSRQRHKGGKNPGHPPSAGNFQRHNTEVKRWAARDEGCIQRVRTEEATRTVSPLVTLS